MEPLIDFLSNNPLYAIGIVVLVLLLIFALIKKMMTFAIVLAILVGAYFYYLHDTANDLANRAESQYESIKGKALNLFE